MRPRVCVSDESGVFVPGLMGAGILLSIGMLLADAVRKMFPARGQRSRAVRAAQYALGRVDDIFGVFGDGIGEPVRVRNVPRSRLQSLLLALVAGGSAFAARAATLSAYHSGDGVLSDRGWTLTFGYLVVGTLATAALVWGLSALLGRHRPPWLEQLASWGPLGTAPEIADLPDPIDLPYTDPVSVTWEDRR